MIVYTSTGTVPRPNQLCVSKYPKKYMVTTPQPLINPLTYANNVYALPGNAHMKHILKLKILIAAILQEKSE